MSNYNLVQPGLFSSTSAFDQSKVSQGQMPLIPENDVDAINDDVRKITAAMQLDLDYILNKLDDALFLIDDPAVRQLIEDARSEVYRNLR